MKNKFKLTIAGFLIILLIILVARQISFYNYYNFQNATEDGVTIIVTDKVINVLDKRVYKTLVKEIKNMINTATMPHIHEGFESYAYGGQDIQHWVISLEDSSANKIVTRINPLVRRGINIEDYINTTVLNNNVENRDLSEFISSKIINELSK